MNVLIFLQNAYSPLYAGKEWPREDWLRKLWRSQTGSMLDNLIEAAHEYKSRGVPRGGLRFYVHNTTPLVAKTPAELLPPDLTHMVGALCHTAPKVVVCCGQSACRSWYDIYAHTFEEQRFRMSQLPTVFLPHPAWRTCRKAFYQSAGTLTALLAHEPVKLVHQLKFSPQGKRHDWNTFSIDQARTHLRLGGSEVSPHTR